MAEKDILEGMEEKNDKVYASKYVPFANYYTETETISAEQEESQHWDELKELYKKGTICRGMIWGVEPVPAQKKVNILTELNGFTITIPDYEFFYEPSFKANYWSSTEDEKFERRYQMARASIGAQIFFCISGMVKQKDEEEENLYVIGASRKAAMSAMHKRFFTGMNAVQVGDVVDATILSVGEYGVTVELCGNEATLLNNQIDAYQYISDSREACVAGQELKVVIKKLEEREDGTMAIEASGATIGNREMDKNLSKLKKNGAYLGFVYAKKGNVYTIIANKARIAVKEDAVLDGKVLKKGDKVSVVISNFTPTIAWGSAKKL